MGCGNKKAKILVIDDQPIILESFRHILNGRCQLLGITATLSDCMAQIRRTDLDLVVVEPLSFQPHGAEVIAKIRRKRPNLKILVFTTSRDLARSVVAAGANGFVLKGESATALRSAVRAMVDGGNYFDERSLAQIRAELARRSETRLPELTELQMKVGRLLGQGLTSKEIAVKLNCGAKWIDKIRAQLITLTGSRNSIELAWKIGAYFALHDGGSAQAVEIMDGLPEQDP